MMDIMMILSPGYAVRRMLMKLKFFILILIVIGLSGCVSDKDKNVKNNNSDNSTHKDLNTGSQIRWETGMIEVFGNEVYFVINWTSRSRVSLTVTGELVNELKDYNGKILRVKGEKAMTSQWSGTIKVELYEVVQ